MIDKLKGARKSLTIWVNAALAGLLANAETVMAGLRDNLPAVSQWLTADMLKYAGLFIIVVNVALRFRTSTDLADK